MTPGTLRRATVPLSDAAMPVPPVTSSASPSVRVRTVRVPSPIASATLVAATLMTVLSAFGACRRRRRRRPSEWPARRRRRRSALAADDQDDAGPGDAHVRAGGHVELRPTWCRPRGTGDTASAVVLTSTPKAPVRRSDAAEVEDQVAAEGAGDAGGRDDEEAGAVEEADLRGERVVPSRTTEASVRPTRTTLAPVAVVTCSTTTSAVRTWPSTVSSRPVRGDPQVGAGRQGDAREGDGGAGGVDRDLDRRR